MARLEQGENQDPSLPLCYDTALSHVAEYARLFRLSTLGCNPPRSERSRIVARPEDGSRINDGKGQGAVSSCGTTPPQANVVIAPPAERGDSYEGPQHPVAIRHSSRLGI